MTEYADPAFPLPSPDFLFHHDLVVWTPASVVVGRGRKWVNQSASAGFTGYATAPSPSELRRAAARGVRVDAVALAPHGTVVDEACDLEVPAAPTNPGSVAPPTVLVGRYSIDAVRPNPSHVRIVLTRIRGENPPHAG